MRISDWSSDVCSSDLPADWQAGDASGNELFKLGTGAADLILRDRRIDNVGTDFRVNADLGNHHIEDNEANNVRRVSGDYTSAPSGYEPILGVTSSKRAVEGLPVDESRRQLDPNTFDID